MTRQRIKELRWVDASTLQPDRRNWRRHPKAQRSALQAMLDHVGVANAVIARETPDGLVLVDGHLRQDMLQGEQVPVLVVDLDEFEAGQVLSTLDPLAAMAQTDMKALQQLVEATNAPVDWSALMPDALPETTGWPEMLDEAPLVGIMTFIVAEDQRACIERAIRAAKKDGIEEHSINQNSNGNALARIAREWLQAQNN